MNLHFIIKRISICTWRLRAFIFEEMWRGCKSVILEMLWWANQFCPNSTTKRMERCRDNGDRQSNREYIFGHYRADRQLFTIQRNTHSVFPSSWFHLLMSSVHRTTQYE